MSSHPHSLPWVGMTVPVNLSTFCRAACTAFNFKTAARQPSCFLSIFGITVSISVWKSRGGVEPRRSIESRKAKA